MDLFERPRASPVCLLERAGSGIHEYLYDKDTVGRVDGFLQHQKRLTEGFRRQRRLYFSPAGIKATRARGSLCRVCLIPN